MRQIEFVYPEDTHVVSVTGTRCDLNCRHCNGIFLKHMFPIDSVHKKKSVLVSGGFNYRGELPVTIEHLEKLKKYKLNIHPGLVDEKKAKLIGKYAEIISFDFPAGNEVIKDVYGLDKSMNDYIYSYKLLKKHCERVVPHICIGLGGNELRAIKLLGNIGFDEIVFLVLIPNKKMNRKPDIDMVVGLIKKTRQLFPGKKISIGCMRPGGSYRDELDAKAISFVDSIVKPSPKAVKLAAEKGFEIKEKKQCCIFT